MVFIESAQQQNRNLYITLKIAQRQLIYLLPFLGCVTQIFGQIHLDSAMKLQFCLRVPLNQQTLSKATHHLQYCQTSSRQKALIEAFNRRADFMRTGSSVSRISGTSDKVLLGILLSVISYPENVILASQLPCHLDLHCVIHSWCNSRIKIARIKGVSAFSNKGQQFGNNTENTKRLAAGYLQLALWT